MIRKHPYIFFFFIVVMAVFVVLVIRRNGNWQQRSIGFVPPDVSSIDSVRVTCQKASLILGKSGEDWKINHHEPAKKEKVELLLSSLQRIEIVSPTARMIRDAISDSLLLHGKHISIFSGGKLVRSMYVYYDSLHIPGTYMMLERSKDPFMVKLKGYETVNIENLFSPVRNNWIDHSLFGYNPEQLAFISVFYPGAPDASFTIDIGKVKVTLSNKNGIVDETKINMQEIKDYLHFFGKISYIIPVESSGPFMEDNPFAMLLIRDINQDQFQLNAFRKYISGQNRKEFDSNLCFAVLNRDRDTILLRYTDIDPLLRHLDDFQKK
jgi:hypothetical protein